MSVFSVLADVLMVGQSLFGGDTALLTESALRSAAAAMRRIEDFIARSANDSRARDRR